MNLNISLASTFIPHKVEIYLPSPCTTNVGVLSTIYTLASHHAQVNVICQVYNRALIFMAVAHPVLLDSVVVPLIPKSAQHFPLSCLIAKPALSQLRAMHRPMSGT